MNGKKKLLIFIFLLGLFCSGYSQTMKKFSKDPDKFLLNMTSFFKDVDDPKLKKKSKLFMEEFAVIWNSDELSKSQKKIIYLISNKMLQKRLKPFPHFYKFLNVFVSLTKSNQSEVSIKAWKESVNGLLDQKRGWVKYFMSYLNTTEQLLSDNTIYESTNAHWKASNNKFVFAKESEPMVLFDFTNITCYAKGDSSYIYNTKGVYYPMKNQWIGAGGRIFWVRAGFARNDVYADMAKYEIMMKTTKFFSDSVLYFNNKYFDRPLMGRAEEKILSSVTVKNATYPRFKSYDKRLLIKGLFKNIDYEGGLLFKGSKIEGAGDVNEKANVLFYKDDKLFIKATSNTFQMKSDKIASGRASVTIYIEEDSIYHPGLLMKYIKDKNQLFLYRDNKGVARSPYFDSYHKLDMYFEAMYWVMDEDIIQMKMMEGVGRSSDALFESSNRYDEVKYYKLRGLDEIHPLYSLRKFVKENSSNVIHAVDFAKFLRIDTEQVKLLLLGISNMGFLEYYPDEDMAMAKDRLFEYLDYRAKKKDYDVLKFDSEVFRKPNAIFNIENNELAISGVEKVYLSDSQNVYLFPTNQELVVNKNRDFVFSGRVHAGLFDFFGRDFSFVYDTFKLNMPVIDSMSFKVYSEEYDDYGERPLIKVETVIENMSGNLLIDSANNKSGRRPYYHYPVFNSKKVSYVYYDRSTILNGAYSKDEFYFKLIPFTIDSLDNFDPSFLSFSGEFKSAGIFPEFEEELKVQPDYSLGFVSSAPESGYDLYGGKAKFYSDIKLSNSGLRGDGSISYLTSTSQSDDFVFFIDSMSAVVQKFEIKEQLGDVEYPPVLTEDVFEQWYPYKDLMIVSQRVKPISMYNGQSHLKGALSLTPTGLNGKGTMQFPDADIISDMFKYKQHVFDADTADFMLKALGEDMLALQTYNYNAHIDFNTRKGEFKSNGGGSKVEFPMNMYICFMDEFSWNMDKDEIELSAEAKTGLNEDDLSKEELAEVDLSGSEFISTHPEQDSVRFKSAKATYSLRKSIIAAKEVKLIKIADAVIFPDKGIVTIHKKARIEQLSNAQIMANNITKYHNILDCTVDIFARRSYSATGTFFYIDEDKREQEIYFHKIDVDTTFQTYAFGEIAESAEFKLSKFFDYKGKVVLTANNEFLDFNGRCKISHDCDSVKPWLAFDSEIDPNNILIPVNSDTRDQNNKRIISAIKVSNDSSGIQAAFLQKNEKFSDSAVVSAEGFLKYDKISGEYRVSNKEKLVELSRPGNYLSLDVNNCVAFGEGRVDFGANLGQIDIHGYGNVKHEMIADSTTMKVLVLMDFFFHDNAMKILTGILKEQQTLRGVNLSSLSFYKALKEIIGEEAADKLRAEISMHGAMKKVPDELKQTMTLIDMPFYWNSETKSYICKGPLAIGGIGKEQINKYVNGYIEIQKKRSGDVFSLYMEPQQGEWFYFFYKKFRLYAVSSNNEFNTILKEEKAENRSLKVKRKEDPYEFIVGTEGQKKEFIRRIKMIIN